MKIVKKMECFFQETIYNWKVKPEYYEKTKKFFNLETYDYTPYARELTEEEMYLELFSITK